MRNEKVLLKSVNFASPSSHCKAFCNIHWHDSVRWWSALITNRQQPKVTDKAEILVRSKTPKNFKPEDNCFLINKIPRSITLDIFLAKVFIIFLSMNYIMLSQVAGLKISFTLARISPLLDGEWKKHSGELPLALLWRNTSYSLACSFGQFQQEGSL